MLNAYLITEDREARVFIAPNFCGALKLARAAHVRDVTADGSPWNEPEDTEAYENTILESCVLVGEVVDWPKPPPATLSQRVSRDEARAFAVQLANCGWSLPDGPQPVDSDLDVLAGELEKFLEERARRAAAP